MGARADRIYSNKREPPWPADRGVRKEMAFILLLLVPMLCVGTGLRTLRVPVWANHRRAVKTTFPRGAWERGRWELRSVDDVLEPLTELVRVHLHHRGQLLQLFGPVEVAPL